LLVVVEEGVDEGGTDGDDTVNVPGVDSGAVYDDAQLEAEGGVEVTSKVSPKLVSSTKKSREQSAL
jgi:hypothetical protein